MFRPLVATATSIAATLHALCLSGVRALVEFGLITGTGYFVLVSTLVVFPPLLLLYDSWRNGQRPQRAAADRPIALPLYRRSRGVPPSVGPRPRWALRPAADRLRFRSPAPAGEGN
jgi:hypothetical protein